MTRFHSYAKSPEGGCPVLPGSKSVLSERSPRFVRERLGKQWYFDHSHIYISKYAYGQKCGKLGFGASIRRKSTICRGCWVAWAFSQTKSNWWTIWRPTMQVFEAILGWLVGGLERFFIFPSFHNSNISQLSQLTKSYFSEGWRKTTKQMGFGDINWWNIEAKSSRSIFGYGIPWSP